MNSGDDRADTARRLGVSWAQAALIRLLGLKRRLLGLHLFYQFVNPIKYIRIGDSGRHALVFITKGAIIAGPSWCSLDRHPSCFLLAYFASLNR
jgi:hypothetical protein